jgi:hypothetical protein
MQHHEEFIALYNKEVQLKEQLKDVGGKRKEIESKIMEEMVAKNITSMKVGPYSIVVRQSKKKKSVSKDAMAEQIAKEVNSSADSVKKAMEKAKENQTVSMRTSLKPIHME